LVSQKRIGSILEKENRSMKLNLFVLEIPVALLIAICYNTASSVAVVLGS